MNKNKSESFIYIDKINDKICDKLIDFYESGLGTAGVPKIRGVMGDPPTHDPKFKDSEESFYTCFPIYYAKALLEVNSRFKKKFIYADKNIYDGREHLGLPNYFGKLIDDKNTR